MRVLVSTKNMPRDEWLKWRRTGVGASDIAAIACISHFNSPYSLWLEKHGQMPDQPESQAAYFGTALETFVAQEFARRTGLKVRRRKAILQHDQHDWMVCNLDYLVIEDGHIIGPLECKTTSAFNRADWVDAKIPDPYYLQVQWQLAITGHKIGYIGVLIGGQEYTWKRVERDEETIAWLIQMGGDFWHNHVLTGIAPEVDGSDPTSYALSQQYKEATGETVRLPLAAQNLVEQYRKAREDENEAKKLKQEAGNKLRAMLGNAVNGIVNEDKVQWTKGTDNAPRRLLVR